MLFSLYEDHSKHCLLRQAGLKYKPTTSRPYTLYDINGLYWQLHMYDTQGPAVRVKKLMRELVKETPTQPKLS